MAPEHAYVLPSPRLISPVHVPDCSPPHSFIDRSWSDQSEQAGSLGQERGLHALHAGQGVVQEDAHAGLHLLLIRLCRAPACRRHKQNIVCMIGSMNYLVIAASLTHRLIVAVMNWQSLQGSTCCRAKSADMVSSRHMVCILR